VATLDEGEKIARALRDVSIDVERVLEVAVQAGAHVIAAESNLLAPSPLIETETKSATARRVTVNIGPPKGKWGWRFIETGAAPHEITGNPLLIFADAGATVTTGRVHHPGMAARPFLRTAFDSKQTGAKNALGEKLLEVIT
jgi:hypothetical protein